MAEYGYEGEFLHGNFHGKGKLNLQNGNLYVGQFHQGTFQGVGTYYWTDGKILHGEFLKNMYHGLCFHIFPDGELNIIMWKNDKKIWGLTVGSDRIVQYSVNYDANQNIIEKEHAQSQLKIKMPALFKSLHEIPSGKTLLSIEYL